MEKIFGYVRESTMQQAMFGYNIEEQKRVIEEYCKYHYQDYELELFIEKGKSATTMNRPELKSLLETVKKSKADKVVFHSLDRLTRDIRDLYTLIEFFDKNNIELVSVMESLDLTTAIGRSHVYNSGVYAQLESERISERTIRALKQGVYEGKYPFSSCPLGYIKKDKRLYLSDIESEVEVIKYIFEKVSDENLNIRELLIEVQRKFNVSMSEDKLRRIIKNKIYTGQIEYRGIVKENFCEAIINEETFKRANVNMKVRKSSRKNPLYLFKNIVRCSNCDNPMVQGSGTGKYKKLYVYYVCNKCGGRASQHRIMDRKMSELENITTNYFQDAQGFHDKKKEIKKLKSYQRKLVDKQKDRLIDVDTFYELYINYENDINSLQTQIDEAKVDNSSFDSLEVKTQKEIINKYISEVSIHFTGNKYSVAFKRK